MENKRVMQEAGWWLEYLEEHKLDYLLQKTLREAIEIINNMTWVSIKERWPEKSGHYLVTLHEWSDGNYLPKYDETRIKILRYHEAIFKLPYCIDKEAEKDTHREVIAWMPLPHIYTEKLTEVQE